MEIRSATPDDAPAIARAHVRSWQAAYRGLLPDQLLADLSVDRRETYWRGQASLPDPTVLVAEEDGTVIGFVSWSPSRDLDADPARVGEIDAIYLDPSAFGRGIGQALFAAATEELRRSGYERATLWVLAGNGRGRRFYEAAGWRPDGVTKVDDIGDVEFDEVRYASDLSAGP